MRKGATYRRLIHTERWLRLRRDKLTADPMCERCRAEGRIAAATEVHHIVPVEDAVNEAEKERLMFDPTNLRSLCHACHLQEHVELGRSGVKLARRRAENQVRQAIDKLFGGGGG